MADKSQRIKELEQEISELKSQLPAHSVKPEMIIKIEQLEDELDRLKATNKNQE